MSSQERQLTQSAHQPLTAWSTQNSHQSFVKNQQRLPQPSNAIKENLSFNQAMKDRIGTGQKIMDTQLAVGGFIPMSSGERRTSTQHRPVQTQNRGMRGAAGYQDHSQDAAKRRTMPGMRPSDRLTAAAASAGQRKQQEPRQHQPSQKLKMAGVQSFQIGTGLLSIAEFTSDHKEKHMLPKDSGQIQISARLHQKMPHQNQSQDLIPTMQKPFQVPYSGIQTQGKHISSKQTEVDSVKNEISQATKFVIQKTASIEQQKSSRQHLQFNSKATANEKIVVGPHNRISINVLKTTQRQQSRSPRDHSEQPQPLSMVLTAASVPKKSIVKSASNELDPDRFKSHKANPRQDVLQSRQELLQNEYKKVIECHPQLTDNYDDTEFLTRMFSKDTEPLRLKRTKQEVRLDSHRSLQRKPRAHSKEPPAVVSSGEPINQDSSAQTSKIGPNRDDCKPASEFRLLSDEKVFLESALKQQQENQDDDDFHKLERLQLINASARFELLAANQQLLDFHVNRTMMRTTAKPEQAQKKFLVSELLFADDKLMQMYNPHHFRQKRLDDMSPFMFGGDSLPVQQK